MKYRTKKDIVFTFPCFGVIKKGTILTEFIEKAETNWWNKDLFWGDKKEETYYTTELLGKKKRSYHLPLETLEDYPDYFEEINK